MDKSKRRLNSHFDIARINWLIETMCHDFDMDRQDIIDAIKDLRSVPIWKQVDHFSEIWMTYS